MQRVYRYERHPGYNKIAGPGQKDLRLLEFGILRVARDERHRFHLQGQEAVLVILGGACEISVDGETWMLERVSVFAEPAMAIYVPRHRQYLVTGIKPTDLAVFMASADQDYLPRLIAQDETRVEAEGSMGYRRRIYNVVGPDFPASRLLVGETYVEAGEWSSYPPHKHDEDRYPEEVRLEQATFFQIDPPQGFALQYLYTADRSLDEVHVVHNDDALAMARGYHPVAAAPGYALYYLWGMAGDGHVIRHSIDPAHAWVAAEAGVAQPVPAGELV